MGKPIASFVNEQVEKGIWYEQEIPPAISGLERSIYVFRAVRKQNLITYDWHGDSKTFCPPMWWDLGIGSGACGLGCRNCFLMLTFRAMRDPLRHVLYENTDDFIHAAAYWLKDPERRRQHTLGLGIDRSDSLLYEGVTFHARNLAPLFAHPTSNLSGNKLVLLTKSANTHYLADIKPEHRKQVVVSFSLNPEPVADLWEGKWGDGVRITPTIARRLEAAKYAQDLGFEVRVRVDPILIPNGWEDLYASWIADVRAMGIHFQYWTLGTYRAKNHQLDGWRERWGLPAMEWQPKKEELVKDGTHYHVHENQRIAIYTTIHNLIQREFPRARVSLCKERVSLCKETHEVRRALRLCNADCNCLI